MCAAKIYCVEILNEGMGILIDDAVTEMQATFVARVVEPMSAVASPFQTRDFPLVPCFGTIEKNYCQRGEYSDISIYMNRLRRIFRDLIARLYRPYAPGVGQASLTTPKTAPQNYAI